MIKAVIDTNVLLVANNQHSNVTPVCVLECINKLQELKEKGNVVIDDNFYIINEYQNKLNTNQDKGVGGSFLKWLLNNRANRERVEQVHITKISSTAAEHFEEFPDSELESRLDPSDRKFVAVANAYQGKAPIWQAADCKWLDWWQELQKHGIQVNFLCPCDVTRFYSSKFPDRGTPALPNYSAQHNDLDKETKGR